MPATFIIGRQWQHRRHFSSFISFKRAGPLWTWPTMRLQLKKERKKLLELLLGKILFQKRKNKLTFPTIRVAFNEAPGNLTRDWSLHMSKSSQTYYIFMYQGKRRGKKSHFFYHFPVPLRKSRWTNLPLQLFLRARKKGETLFSLNEETHQLEETKKKVDGVTSLWVAMVFSKWHIERTESKDWWMKGQSMGFLAFKRH